jgi:hypothetical protein
MSTDPKAVPPAAPLRHKSLKIFTYPKIIFIWPTLVMSIVCCVGMILIGDDHTDPKKNAGPTTPVSVTERDASGKEVTRTVSTAPKRFSSPQNVLGVLFIVVLGLNLLIMSVDFPRFTIIAIIFLAVAVTFFLLWLNVWLDIVKPLVHLMESVFAVANASFYGLVALTITVNFAIIWVARYLDYWEILPNEILHNHGPFSDLERFPTMNLKFDKEIPDILEYALLRAGRLVLHVQNERKAIVLDNVLWIDHKEQELKKLMSRMEVRITTDQEAAAEAT